MDLLIEQLKDPLHQTTRKVRKGLLLSSIIGILIVKMDLVPTRITALGIEFSQSDQESLLSMIALLVAYYLINFVIYLWTEFASWKIAVASNHAELDHQRELDHIESKADSRGVRDQLSYKTFIADMFRKGRYTLIIRIGVEIAVPIGLSLASIYLTISKAA